MRGTWGTQGFSLDYEISWTQHYSSLHISGGQGSALVVLTISCSPRSPNARDLGHPGLQLGLRNLMDTALFVTPYQRGAGKRSSRLDDFVLSQVPKCEGPGAPRIGRA